MPTNTAAWLDRRYADLRVGPAPYTRVCMTSPSVSFDTLPRRSGVNTALIGAVTRLLAGDIAPEIRCRVHGVRARFVWGSSLITNEVGPMLWADFLPAALAQGRYVPAPTPQVIGSGLQHVQPALDTLRAGVLARKLVVLL